MPRDAKPTNGQLHMYLQARREGNAIKWSLDDNCPPDVGACKPIRAPKDSGSCKIHFNLLPTPGIAAQFDTADPIWVELGEQCPPKKGNNTDGQIEASCCDTDTLVLKNKNKGEPADFTYQLNFINAPALDPVIRNGGGNGLIGDVPTLGIALAAGIVGAAAGYVACSRKLRRD